MTPDPRPSTTASRNARKSNDAGKAFQTRLELTIMGYRAAGRADLEKIDPPLKVYGTGARRNVVFLSNPWLDYAGVWSEMGGRSLHLEAKSTEGERLGLGGGGVSDNQIAAMRRWTRAGAIAAVVWHHRDAMKIIPARELLDAFDAGARGLQWRHMPAVPRGTGLIEFDILAELAARTF